jgi:histidinol-phosphate aminotransferase
MEAVMNRIKGLSRRGFVGGAATALGYLGLKPGADLWGASTSTHRFSAFGQQTYDYDSYAKLSSNENPYGPTDKMWEAMDMAKKYSMRYGYPDGDIQEKIAESHGVDPENIMLGAGSGEVLRTMGLTYMGAHKKVVGVEPSYSTVYRHATGLKGDAILLPLNEDYTQNIPAMIHATMQNRRDLGFVYLCNPNNPTGVIVTQNEVRQLLDGIPEDMPTLIDEAYHHFVEDPRYATAIPYVKEGRRVVIARTFSKIYGMAALRIGYAVAPADMIQEMRNYSTGSVNVLARWGAAAALDDPNAEKQVFDTTLRLRKQTAGALRNLGYDVIPSETNFIMVHTGRPVQEVQQAFREKGVLVGRPFPPMLDHLRVSIGTEEEMSRFLAAWKEIFPAKTAADTARG